MDRKEFLRELKSKLPSHLQGRPYLLFCRDPGFFGFDRSCYYRYDFQSAVDIIKDLAEGLSQSKPAEKERIFRPNINFADELTSEILIDKITPWVKDIRQKIFGSPEPPFKGDWDGAIRWIEEEAQKKYYEPVSQKLLDDLAALSAKFAERDMILSLSRDSLPYAKKGEAWQHTRPVNGPKMALLEGETRRIAKPTGFSQAALVMFVLVGAKPFVSRVSVACIESGLELQKGQEFYGKKITLTFRGADFTAREMQRHYGMIRRQLRLRKKIPPKKKHLQVYRLIQELGPPPIGRRYWNYWERALKEWKRRYKKKKPQTVQGLRAIYERNLRDREP